VKVTVVSFPFKGEQSPVAEEGATVGSYSCRLILRASLVICDGLDLTCATIPDRIVDVLYRPGTLLVRTQPGQDEAVVPCRCDARVEESGIFRAFELPQTALLVK